MYQGYRLKINNVVFPNVYMAKGSYSCVEKNRVVETWTDADLVEHKISTDNKKTVIQFNIREHDSAEHGAIVAFFKADDNISVEYYSDRTDTYKTGTFRINEPKFSHKTAYGSTIQYAATSITLTEN